MMPEYKQRVVAFIDILGSKSLIERLPKDKNLHSRFYSALQVIKHLEKIKSLPQKTNLSDLEVSVFSDSIVISGEEENLFSIIWSAGHLQADLLYLGVLTRGGIAIGKTVHQQGILYGDGMLEAYRLESETAVYPRIIVAAELIRSRSHQFLRKWCERDLDGHFFVDPFKFDAVAGQADELAADGYDPRFCYFDEVHGHLFKMLETTKSRNHLAKFKWIADRYNIAAMEFNKSNREKCQLL